MDENQIKKEIEKKIDKWGIITLFNILLLIAIILSILYGVISTIVGLYIILILSLITLVSFATFFIYMYVFIRERYDIFIERKKLKENILDILTFVWLISPVFILISVPLMMAFPTAGAIIGVTFSIFWVFGLFILGKDEKE